MDTNKLISYNPRDFRTIGDFDLVRSLLKKFSLYDIPDHARSLVINQAIQTLEDPETSAALKMSASKLLLEADKRNIDLVKLAMPQKHEHIEVKQMSDEALEMELINIHDAIRTSDNGRALERIE
jgi:hypothetical protein